MTIQQSEKFLQKMPLKLKILVKNRNWSTQEGKKGQKEWINQSRMQLWYEGKFHIDFLSSMYLRELWISDVDTKEWNFFKQVGFWEKSGGLGMCGSEWGLPDPVWMKVKLIFKVTVLSGLPLLFSINISCHWWTWL